MPSSLQYSASTASTFLSAIVGATAALTGFVVTVSVLVVQMATGTFSARYMRLWYRDRVLHVLLALLIGTFTFSFTLLAGVEEGSVPDLGITTSGALMALDLFLFLFFLDRFIHRLRPVAVAALVAEAGGAPSSRSSGRHPASTRRRSCTSGSRAARSRRWSCGARTPAPYRRSTVAASSTSPVARAARGARPPVGDFVPEGAAVISVYGGDAASRSSEHRLRGMIALGVERTIEQDPAFALRIMVDVAIRALSPAVNDPTTAVQVLNHLGDTAAPDRRRGARPPGGATATDPEGAHPRPRLEDFLALGVTEIRQYGASSVQVARRLRALLEELHGSVLPEHRRAVEDELARLEAQVELEFGTSADLDRAGEADPQGIGGAPAL